MEQTRWGNHPEGNIFSWLNHAASKWIAIPFLKVYHTLLSPLFVALGSECRFYPTCSHYAEEAFRIHGFLRGFGLSFVRVAKCNPLHSGGIDPVPGSALEKELNKKKSENAIQGLGIEDAR